MRLLPAVKSASRGISSSFLFISSECTETCSINLATRVFPVFGLIRLSLCMSRVYEQEFKKKMTKHFSTLWSGPGLGKPFD